MSKLTDEQIRSVFYNHVGEMVAFACAIERLVEQEKDKRISNLETALQSVANDILRNDDGAITDTLWHGNAETVLDFISNTLGIDVESRFPVQQVEQSHAQVRDAALEEAANAVRKALGDTTKGIEARNAIRALQSQAPIQSDVQDAARYRWLIEQAGHWQDGSDTIVKLYEDDATRTAFVAVGNKQHYVDGGSFDTTIDAAMTQEK